MDAVLWPFMFLCLNGCYGPPQTLRGQVERLPESAQVRPAEVPLVGAAPLPARPLSADEQVALAREISDPVAWAERVFAAGRPDLLPSRLIELHRRGVPDAHLDALHAREMRAREADAASRVAEREQQLGRRYDEDLRRLEQSRPVYPAYPAYPVLPGYPFGYPGVAPGLPYGGVWPVWR